MARSRCVLHKSKLDEFSTFCRSRGWVKIPVKGAWEVLRMVKYAKGNNPKKKNKLLLVFTKHEAKEHYTVYAESLRMFNKWRGKS